MKKIKKIKCYLTWSEYSICPTYRSKKLANGKIKHPRLNISIYQNNNYFNRQSYFNNFIKIEFDLYFALLNEII